MATIQRICEDSADQLDNKQGYCISGMSVGHGVFNIEQLAVDCPEPSPAVDNTNLYKAHGSLGEDATNNPENTEDRNVLHSPNNQQQENDENLTNMTRCEEKNNEDDNIQEKETNNWVENEQMEADEETTCKIDDEADEEDAADNCNDEADEEDAADNCNDEADEEDAADNCNDEADEEDKGDHEADEFNVPNEEKTADKCGDEADEIKVPDEEEKCDDEADEINVPDGEEKCDDEADENNIPDEEETGDKCDDEADEEDKVDDEADEINVADEEEATDKGEIERQNFQNDVEKSSSSSDSNGSENLQTDVRESHVERRLREGNEDWSEVNANSEKRHDYQPEESQMTDLLNNFEILQKNDPLSDEVIEIVDKCEEQNVLQEASKKDENVFGVVTLDRKEENTISQMKKIVVKTLDQINAEVIDSQKTPEIFEVENKNIQSVDDESEEIVVLKECRNDVHVVETGKEENSQPSTHEPNAMETDNQENSHHEVTAMETDKEENSHQSADEAYAMETDKEENSQQSPEDVSVMTPDGSENSQHEIEIPQTADEEKTTKSDMISPILDKVTENDEEKTTGTETSTPYSEVAEEEDSKSSHVESETSCADKQLEEEPVLVVDEKLPLKRGRPKSATILQRPRMTPIRLKTVVSPDLEAKAAKIKQAAALQNHPDGRRRQYHRRCKPSVIIDGDDSPDEIVVATNEIKTLAPVPPPTLKKKYEIPPPNVYATKRPRFSATEEDKPTRPPSTVDDRVANSLLEKLQKSVGSALSITIKKKKPIAAETLNALEQLKNMSEISTTKITRNDIQASCSSRPSLRKSLPPAGKKAPAPAMDLPIITSVISSKNETGPFYNAPRRTRVSVAPAGRSSAPSSNNSIPYVVLD